MFSDVDGRDDVSELRPPTGLLFIAQMSMESHGGVILKGKNRRTRRKTCPSRTMSTTNPTCTDQGANPAHVSVQKATSLP